RTAIVLRSYDGYTYHHDDILNLRALIIELGLNTGGQFDIFILHQVKDGAAIFADDEIWTNKARDAVPAEFEGFVELWSEIQMRALYPGLDVVDDWHRAGHINGVHRGNLAPLQWFATRHPEYDFFYNWEMDVRYIGNYYELLNKAEVFARGQPRGEMTWNNSQHWIIEGTQNWSPPSTTPSIGIGEEADLIAFDPIFDPINSGWYFEDDIVNYPSARSTPRRASIITNARLSRPLLLALHAENSLGRHIHCEAFPASIAYARHLKAVYVPHPVFYEHDVDRRELDTKVNDQRFFGHEWDMNPSTYYYRAGFAKTVYRGWHEHAETCRRAVLLHPIKDV
ncbi:hypothetical protein SAICODRAFT_39581, partial [Saitoella complicata NRRL Y-17804]